MKHLPDLLMIVSDQLSTFGSKFINAFGAVSIGAGAAVVSIGNDALSAAATESWLTPQHVMIASIFGSVCFGIKHLYDFLTSCYANYKAWRKRKSAKAMDNK